MTKSRNRHQMKTAIYLIFQTKNLSLILESISQDSKLTRSASSSKKKHTKFMVLERSNNYDEKWYPGGSKPLDHSL